MGAVGRMAEASNNRREGVGNKEKLGGRGRAVASGACHLGCSADPGSAVMMVGIYTMEAVQAQVILQGPAGRETWLGVDLRSISTRGSSNL